MFIVCCLSSCGPSKKYSTPPVSSVKMQPVFLADYDISLISVERPAKARERYGEQKIDGVNEKGQKKYSFEDRMVKITWAPTGKDFTFLLYNKTDHTIKIIWDNASFVDENGLNHKVMHSGVKYAERNNSQAPSVITRRGYIEDLIFPGDRVVWIDGIYSRYGSTPGTWHKEPIMPSVRGGASGEELRAKATPFIGKTFSVLLPLQIEDVLNDYLFTFKVNSVSITEKPAK